MTASAGLSGGEARRARQVLRSHVEADAADGAMSSGLREAQRLLTYSV